LVEEKNKLSEEKAHSDSLLLNILPSEIAEELKKTGAAQARQIDTTTVLFADFKDFTRAASNLNPQQLVHDINEYFTAFDHIMDQYNIEKIKTIGDAYMAAGGVPHFNAASPVDTVNAGLAMIEAVDKLNLKRAKLGNLPFEVRIGINSGPVVAGIVGIKKFAYDIWGDTVNIASRMETSGEPGKVNISSSTYNLVKDHFICTFRGKIEAKNLGQIDMYFVERKAI
jgi:class 3 adenylate cyclase